jgi:hypothetical protein
LRRKDPMMMKGYDIVGPWIASKVHKYKLIAKGGVFLTEYYRDLVENKPLNTKQKIVQAVSAKTVRPLYRLIGRIASYIERDK